MSYFFLRKIINFNMKEKSLFDCKLNKKYLISRVMVEDKDLLNYLTRLMIKEKEYITILHKSFFSSAFIVNVLEINYALDSKICKRIFVYDA